MSDVTREGEKKNGMRNLQELVSTHVAGEEWREGAFFQKTK